MSRPDPALKSAMPDPLLVLLAENDEIISAILARTLVADGMRVNRAPAAADDLETMAAADRPQVVLIGPTYPRGKLIALIPRMLSHATRTLILSERELDDVSAHLLLSGASGFLLIDEATLRDIPEAVRTIAAGASALHPTVVHTVLERWRTMQIPRMGAAAGAPDPTPRLTVRELDVLRGLHDGLTNRMIGSRLGISEKTVEAHKSRLYAKLGARNQPHAVRVGIELGFI